MDGALKYDVRSTMYDVGKVINFAGSLNIDHFTTNHKNIDQSFSKHQ
jgi:hypothetical protein